jgi:flagellar FliJ protein
MKFHFSYEKLLEHRRQEEEVARRDFMESFGRLENEKNLQKKMYAEWDQTQAEIFTAQTNPQGAAIDRIVQLNQFLDGQKIRIGRQREVIINYTTIVEQKNELLVAAAKETKILEKLKEKKLMEFKRLQKKIETKQTDELVVTRFKSAGGGK